MTALMIRPDLSTTAEPFTAEVVTITPKVAEHWLARNVRNRKLKPGSVNAYARDMIAGRWHMTGEAIKFDSNGALADGQNRLHAVIKAGVPVTMLVVRGVAPDAQDVMDSGVKRSAIDALVLKGKQHPSIIAAAARFALSEPAAGFSNGTRLAKTNVTNSEIAEWIEEQGEALSTAATLASHYYPAIDMPQSVLCIGWMNLVKVDPDAVAIFFSTIADCQTSGKGDPRLALISRLRSIRANKERLTQSAYLSLLFRTWNAWRTGSTLRHLSTQIDGTPVKIPTRLK